MSIRSNSLNVLFLTVLASPSWAAEPPQEEAVPTAADGKKPVAEAARADQDAVNPAYLGMVSAPIPEVLTAHLGVRNGEGVLVRSVLADGPADNAGLQTNDVILSIAGRPAFSPEDVEKTILSHQPGETIKIGLIQHGEGLELDVTLGELTDRVARLDRRMRHGPNANDFLKSVVRASIRTSGPEGVIELSIEDGDTHLIARDKGGELQHEGPWNDEEDWAAAPEGVRKRAQEAIKNWAVRRNLVMPPDGKQVPLAQ
ncbi:MAG: PDZ domain-containing protein [Akkermansiaceae bacterium]|nr:PDZ domain-containing protein [Akkermansiaceae bacterium]